jgi:transcriptional regulator with XRE-family HTH domain
MENKKEIGKRIRAVRQRLKMSQEKFAQYLGVTNSAVSSYETGDAYPSIPVLMKTSGLGHVTFDWLIMGHEMQSAGLEAEEAKLVKAFRKSKRQDQLVILRVAENSALAAALIERTDPK